MSTRGILVVLCAGLVARANVGASGRRPQSVLALGRSSGCAVLANGGVSCWGTNEFGQLGTGQVDDNLHVPAAVPGLSDVVSVAMQRDFACALTGAGNVKCWGSNGGSWLGDGTTSDHFTPVLVQGPNAGQTLAGAKALSVGLAHSCVVTGRGDVLCWGANSSGQLGTNDTLRRAIATLIYNPASTRFVDVAVGSAHTCALASDGTVWCWGGNQVNQLNSGNGLPSYKPVQVGGIAGARSLSAGGDHSCVVRADGTVKCWGTPEHFQLGDNNTLARVKAVSAGLASTCALTAAGEVYCWGDNTYRTFGAGREYALADPTLMPVPNAVAVAVGRSSVCVANGAGQVLCWGENFGGELGDGTRHHRQATDPFVLDLRAMGATPMTAAGSYHSCALAETTGPPSARCWGQNSNAQVGDGTTVSPRLLPVSTTPMAAWPTSVQSGNSFTCALESNGTAQCWGLGTLGALGNGVLTRQTTPIAVAGGLGGTGLQLSAGWEFAMALLADGTVKAWGTNAQGQLGDGTTAQRNTPVSVLAAAGTPLGGITAVAAGAYHACFLKNDGTVWCVGSNSFGQLGTNNTTNSVWPVATQPLAGRAIGLTAGWYHTCALLDDGQIQCWGRNATGALGDGTTTDRWKPTSTADLCVHSVGTFGAALSSTCSDLVAQICAADPYCCNTSWDGICINEVLTIGNQNPSLGVNRAVALQAANSQGTCAIAANGELSCWGYDGYGQLGNGGYTNEPWPWRAAPLSRAGSVATGPYHTCGTMSDGTMWCWGFNGYGEIGDGTTTTRPWPVSVTSF
jgi:alpha-tubulin suppressor-like RCC1 family protein